MRHLNRLLAGTALAVLMLSGGQPAGAQDGNAVISAGVGVGRIVVPDVNFTIVTNTAGNTIARQENIDTDDQRVFAVNGAIAVPMNGGRTAVLQGFYAGLEDDNVTTCVATAVVNCSTGHDLVDNPNRVSGFMFTVPGQGFRTLTDRDIDNWSVSIENQWQLSGHGGGEATASSSRYLALGADVRGLNQDIDIRATTLIRGAAARPEFSYSEDLDTTYYGIFAAFGGDYNLPFFRSLRSGWGLHSSFRLWGGVYSANADYDGAYANQRVGQRSGLSLSTSDVAFIGGLTNETRKKIGRRTTLSLRSDYEYYSWVPDMRYNDRDTNGGAVVNAGSVAGTRIGDDDAFTWRTTFRLSFKLGPDHIMQEPMK